MRNIKLSIEYDGTKYCGWQRQDPRKSAPSRKNHKLSIQEVIESCLAKILRHKICLYSSGRTDSGVHAIGQVASFKISSSIELGKLRLALNGNLPKEIRISEVKRVPLAFHSRFSAKSKTYRYYILNQDYKSPFLRGYSYWFKFPLNINNMKKAAGILEGKHDFKAFCASGSGAKDTNRTIKNISIYKAVNFGCNLICIEIEADGFLYNMVRNIAGTLIEVGRGRFGPSYLNDIIKSKKRSYAGFCVPAKGLFLIKVYY